jgi:predicted nuclease of restriction endonuclease-like (RecB) superfamily
VAVKRRKKRIQKKVLEKLGSKGTEYLQFFKYYYNRLGAEHPRWSSSQITAIIKLLWKKRNLNTKMKSKKKIRNLQLNPISGRVMYRKENKANGH